MASLKTTPPFSKKGSLKKATTYFPLVLNELDQSGQRPSILVSTSRMPKFQPPHRVDQLLELLNLPEKAELAILQRVRVTRNDGAQRSSLGQLDIYIYR